MTDQLAFDLAGTSAPAPAPVPALPDDPARHTIEHALDVNLFVEAGAGSGKTGSLVARVVALCEHGVPLTSIAAITFTEKAAAELRHRIRDRLTKRGRGEAALVEQAAIGTLHAFARRILQEFPIEAGLPPAFSVLDEVESDLAFTHRWSAFLDQLLLDDTRARLVSLAAIDKVTLLGLRTVAESFGDNWDLVAERVDLTPPPPTPIDVSGLLAEMEDLLASTHPPAGDKVEQALGELQSWITQLHALWPDGTPPLTTADHAGLDVLTVLSAMEGIKDPFTGGNKSYWRATPTGEAGLFAFRERYAALGRRAKDLLAAVRHERTRLIGAELGRFTLDAATDRRRRGELEFHDLLVLARRVVATNDDVRRRLHDRYRRLLLDEFQDTDPIQLELAVLIAADPDDPATHWLERHPLPGRLFVVGDPKQSIYRFRRADISQYLAARDRLPAEVLTLSSNFRTVEPVVRWVNEVFGRLIVGEPDVQPDYVALDAERPSQVGATHVVVVGDTHHGDEPAAEDLRTREATDIAAAVRTAVADGWLVDDDADGVRPCQWGDIAILLPARTSLPALEAALAAAEVPYRTENSSLVYAAEEIRSILSALRAVDDPTNELALVAALRSSLFGCSDVDLYRWYERGGRWNLAAPRPERLADDPVADAFASLDRLEAARHWDTPAQLVERFVEDRRVFEAALATTTTRDQWRRIRFLVDQARAWSEAGGASLRGWLAWTARQAAEGRYVADVVLPETDHDSVRILTVHAAKGLEFHVVAISGLTTRPTNRGGVSVAWPRDGWLLRTSGKHVDPDWEAYKPLDEQMSHAERLRLLYVACTRARDHLIVSLHRKTPPQTLNPETATSAELLASVAPGPHLQVPLIPSTTPVPAAGRVDSEFPWVDAEVWATERERALRGASRPAAVGASRLRPPRPVPEPGLQKDPVDLDLPPWQRGRYGTAVGRAVHAVLQAADLTTGADIDALAEAQAGAEGVMRRTDVVAGLARSALSAPTVRLVADGAAHWRELYLAAPFADLVVEGYIDLLVRTPDGLVVVDYKTDATPDDAALAEKVAEYADQLAAYGLLVEEVLQEPVVAGRLVFCRDGPAREISVPNWPATLAALRERLAAGATTL